MLMKQNDSPSCFLFLFLFRKCIIKAIRNNITIIVSRRAEWIGPSWEKVMYWFQTGWRQLQFQIIQLIYPLSFRFITWAHGFGDCIESLKNQKLPGLEFIFVNDCSTDDSLSVIEDFAREDNRVRILCNTVNSGSGFSRNRGIEAARGKFLSFVDPDDWICDDFYEYLFAKAIETECEIAKGVRIMLDDGVKAEDISQKEVIDRINAKLSREERDTPLYTVFTYEHQTAIYSSKLFRDSEVRYGNTRTAQDITFLAKVCYNANSIAITDKAVYYYRIRTGSVTSAYTSWRVLAQMNSMAETIGYMKNKADFPSVYHISYVILPGRFCIAQDGG